MSEVTQHNGLYKPLAKTGETRLLYIESLEECGSNDYKLWCSIKHINLHQKVLDDVEVNERVRYEALSYEWGSEENPQHIWIRGHPTPVLIRENLYIALVALLLPDAWRPLWVDAICINQDDFEERNSQVTQMATIYSSADLVVVWLGREAANSSSAMKFLEQIEAAPLTCDASDITRFITRTNYKSIVALQALCSRTYWNRLWIIQEVSRAQDVVLQCGLDAVPWKKFRAACNIVQMALEDDLAVVVGEWALRVSLVLGGIRESRAAQLVSLREHIQEINAVDARPSTQGTKKKREHDILTVFERNSDAECLDPHDMIFGLLSITLRCCQRAVPVDYDKPAHELCREVLYHHIFEHHSQTTFIGGQQLLRRSQLLHKRLNATPLTFSNLPPTPNYMICGFKFLCSPQRPIRYLSQRSSDLLRTLQILSALTCEPRGWQNLEISSERDLVCSIPQVYSSGFQLRGSNYLLPREQEKVSQGEEIQEALVYLLARARKEVPEPARVSYRIAVDEGGGVYFVPANTQLGDLICEFGAGVPVKGSGITAVLRDTAGWDCFVAGRAISFFKNMPSVTGSTGGTIGTFPTGFDYSLINGGLPLDCFLWMDAYAVQLLTRPSSFSRDTK